MAPEKRHANRHTRHKSVKGASGQAGKRGSGEPGPASARENYTPAYMEPLAVHHVGIAVPSIDDALHFYGETLGLAVTDALELPDRQLKVTFVQAANVLLELLEPTDPDTPVARFLERRGPGLHHLCFGTTDIREHLRDLKDKRVELIDEAPRPGAHGEVAFLQPSAALGVLVELLQPTAPTEPVERPSPTPEPAQPTSPTPSPTEPTSPTPSPTEPTSPVEPSSPTPSPVEPASSLPSPAGPASAAPGPTGPSSPTSDPAEPLSHMPSSAEPASHTPSPAESSSHASSPAEPSGAAPSSVEP